MSNSYCCVPMCKSWKKRDPNLHFFNFPSDDSKVQMKNHFNKYELVSRRKVWINVLKIGKKVSPFMKVCSLHFDQQSFTQSREQRTSNRKFLKKNAIPTLNLPLTSANNVENPGPSNRQNRLIIRNRAKEANDTPAMSSFCEENLEEELQPCENSVTEADIDAANTLLLFMHGEQKDIPKKMCDFQVQVNTPQKLTLCNFITDDRSLTNLTGLCSENLLNSILRAVNLVFKDNRIHKLSVKERVILTFTKMKWNLSYSILAIFFGITVTLCKTYITDMFGILAGVLKCAFVFPSVDEIKKNIPLCFKNFEDTQMVLDCTEIFIQTPKCLCCRVRFYSHYKGALTVKFMTGVSPAGLITFISEPYGGRASDKVIFDESNLIEKLEKNSAIMVDKGFVIDNVCDLHNIKMYRPPFLRNQTQLTATDAEFNTKIASARVHIERSNQRIKIFKILGGKLQWGLIPYIDQIFTIACAVTNLSAPILSNDRFFK